MTETTALDRERRYLVPVDRIRLPDEPDLVHLALYEWQSRGEFWVTGLALCGRSTEQGPLAAGTEATCPDCQAFRPKYQAILDRQAGVAIERSTQAVLLSEVQRVVKASGLKQKWLAARLSISEKHLSQLMTGKVQMTLDWAEQILGLCQHELVVSVRPKRGFGW